jgi:hypothetical protein
MRIVPRATGYALMAGFEARGTQRGARSVLLNSQFSIAVSPIHASGAPAPSTGG